MSSEKLKKSLSFFYYVVNVYIFFDILVLNASLIPDTQVYCVYFLALLGNLLLVQVAWQTGRNWRTKGARLLVWIFLIILSIYDFAGLVYLLFLLQIMIVSLQATSIKKLMRFNLIFTATYLSTFYHNINLREDFFDWGIIFTAINFGASYLLFTIRKNQNKLNELNKILGNFLDTTSNGIQFIDKEGRTRILNPAAETIYGKNQEEVYGKFDWDLFYDGKKLDEYGNYTSLITETLETGKMYKNVEKTVIKKENGNKVTFLVETFRLFDDNGELMGAMGVYRDITEQKDMERQLLDAHYEVARMAVTDGLTELYNVRYFRQRLNEEVAKAYKSNLSLLIIDVDYFKIYNDLYGHLAGDKVLKHLAKLIKDNVRETDLVARYGGEEFTVILPGMEKQKAKEIAERIRCAIRDFNFLGQEKLPCGKLTVTIGIASIPDDAQTAEELIKIADDALYRGKYATRDTVVDG